MRSYVRRPSRIDAWGFPLENKPKAAQAGSPKCPECREVSGRRHPELGYWICQACYAISDDRGWEMRSADVSRMVREKYGQGVGWTSHVAGGGDEDAMDDLETEHPRQEGKPAKVKGRRYCPNLIR